MEYVRRYLDDELDSLMVPPYAIALDGPYRRRDGVAVVPLALLG